MAHTCPLLVCICCNDVHVKVTVIFLAVRFEITILGSAFGLQEAPWGQNSEKMAMWFVYDSKPFLEFNPSPFAIAVDNIYRSF